MQSKEQLRKEHRAWRKKLKAKERRKRSKYVCDHLDRCYSDISIVMGYIPRDNELDILPQMQRWVDRGAIVLIPKWDTGDIEPVVWKEDQEWNGTNGIDLVLVPGIVFDKANHRIGFGKGYYDRFLSKHNYPTLGIAYRAQVVKEIPIESHDIAVDQVMTDFEGWLNKSSSMRGSNV